MPNPRQIISQIKATTSDLIGSSLCNDQNFPSLTGLPEGICEVTFGSERCVSVAMRNIPYVDMYIALNEQRAFNLKMVDGAIIQMAYEFSQGNVKSHRLAFFPSPFLEEYQNNPNLYEEDEIYADILFRGVVAFPIRFDFSAAEEKFIVVDHPKSHITFGQYQNCRIPVTAPVMPFRFIDFILRNFYNTAYKRCSEAIGRYEGSFPDTIHAQERQVCYLSIP
jgi:hypothetical protein